MDTSNPLAIIWHARVLSSGNPTLDTLAHWTTWLAVLSATLTLTLIFARAIQQHRPRHPSARLPRAFHLFLLLALAALLITSALRYEHKRLAHAVRRGTLDPARAGRDTEMRLGGFNAVDRRFNRSIAARAQAKADLMRRRFEPLWAVRYATTVSVEREKGPRERVQAKLLREAKEEVRAEKGRLPFFRPPDWPERKDSSWEYFDLLLDSPERFAWTAQWMVGLTAWMLYVSVECGRRRLAQPVAWSFVCLGGLVSLAMAQSLLFALLLIVPARQTGHITVPRSSLVYLEVLGLGMSLHVLKVFFQTDLAAKVLESNEELTEENFQLFLDSFKAFAPAFALSTMVMAHPRSGLQWLSRRFPCNSVKQRYVRPWNVIAIASLYIYFRSASEIWHRTKADHRHQFFLGASTHPWFQRRNPMDHRRDPLLHIFGVLGDNLWVNAVAFDVVLSGLALACWSVAANLDARSMVKCGLFPWVDQITERIKIMRYHTLPEILPSGGLRGGATRSGRDYLLPEGAEEVSSDEEPLWIKRRSHRTVQRKGKRAQLRDSTPPAPEPRSRKQRSVSSRAPSQQPEEPRGRRPRSTGRGVSMPASIRASVSPEAHHQERGPSTIRRSSRLRDRGERVLMDKDERESDERTLLPARPAFADMAGQAEQAGLTLAMLVLGGLGMGSAAVLGAGESAV